MTEQPEALEVRDGGDEEAVLADVGERVKLARQRAQMTQTALAKALGMTATAVSFWEAGKRDMGVARLLLVAEACCVPASSLLPEEHREPPSVTAGDGQFMFIAFMGRVERTGYVTEITLGGEAGFHIDLPDRLWGGNPLAWEEYSAKVLFSRCPLTEEFVRGAWEAGLRAAAKRRQQEAEWRRADEQRALTAGSGDDDEDAGSPF